MPNPRTSPTASLMRQAGTQRAQRSGKATPRTYRFPCKAAGFDEIVAEREHAVRHQHRAKELLDEYAAQHAHELIESFRPEAEAQDEGIDTAVKALIEQLGLFADRGLGYRVIPRTHKGRR